MTTWIEPVTLVGKHVRLEPMTEAQVPELAQIDDMRGWVREILSRAEKGTDLPFVAIHLASGRLAGTTRYLNIMPGDRGLEVGGTWYGLEFQRTPVNTECKYLLLRHAFETLGCIRVQLKTDLRNERSQKAIERIGAKKEGVLRNHMILPDGRIRHSVFYSILDSEWSDVKKNLEAMMTR
jgi:RimJ/RimL family protein N-acetyltransferase